MSSVPQSIMDLVERFDHNIDLYHSPRYNETQVRREFIDPLFMALGWDVENREGASPRYQQVIHEAAVRVHGEVRSPDYCFRMGPERKFFVEAKKPAVDIRYDIHPAYQLRRYAWTAKLPLSILTDFEEFSVYDCRIRPKPTDKASTARILYVSYDQYPERWNEIVPIFSREAVLRGDYDRHAEATRGKRGTQEVDTAFLEEIESWRNLLARNIALRNPDLSRHELNFAVQRIIDRIIFLRICEDREIEPYEQLRDAAKNRDVYAELLRLCHRADERYNSGLFHFREEKGRKEAPDTLTPSLAVDDRVLAQIIDGLYYPESPYAFEVLGVDILGNVYEQFLGSVIRLTPSHRAIVEQKPEVRKAGGVYYTPKYIVDYIVRHTVGELCEGKMPGQIAKLRILDPACGSGSFLLGAYQYLLDYHMNWYVEHPTKQARQEVYQGKGGDWYLTTQEKKRILLNNIYGVDIDPQAVEVTKLSLLLKVLEDESQESIAQQMAFWRERALPDLADNIKCGNSLIGPDYWEGKQIPFTDEEELREVNTFDWEVEFPDIVAGGGFDAVIGNPPYVRHELLRSWKPYFQEHYDSYDGTADLYVYFMEKSLRLLKRTGRYAIIVSRGFLHTTFGRNLRQYIADSAAILSFVDFGGLAVFDSAKDTYVCIPVLTKGHQAETVSVATVESLSVRDLHKYAQQNQYQVPAKRLQRDTWLLKTQQEIDVFSKISSAGVPLGRFLSGGIFSGVKTGLNEAFVVDVDTRNELLSRDPKTEELVHPFYSGKDIRRYCALDIESYVIVIPVGWTAAHTRATTQPGGVPESTAWRWLQATYPAVAQYLHRFAAKARRRRDQGDYWWELRPCDYYDVLEGKKIVYPDIAKWPRFYLDETGAYISNTAYALNSSDPYLLGILNSKLFWFSISNISIPFGTRAGKYRYRLTYQYMERVPICTINFDDAVEQARHERMVALVERMLDLHKRKAEARTPREQELYQRQIDATDAEIDHLVYELYDLAEDEIRIVEEATQ